MWLLASYPMKQMDNINKLLAEDYEPFAITSGESFQQRIWLKKHIEEDTGKGEVPSLEEIVNEISDKSANPRQRRSRKVSSGTSGQGSSGHGDSESGEHPAIGDGDSSN